MDAEGLCNEPGDQAEEIAVGIELVDRIVVGVVVAVRPDARFGHAQPVGLDEERQFRVVVAVVEELQFGVFVVAFTEEALVLFRQGDVEGHLPGDLAEGAKWDSAVLTEEMIAAAPTCRRRGRLVHEVEPRYLQLLRCN